jgi:hypothetical protein
MDTFGGASDPFVECYWRKGRDGNDTLFYTTKVIEDVESPDWDETIEFANYQKGAGQVRILIIQNRMIYILYFSILERHECTILHSTSSSGTLKSKTEIP